MKNIDKEKPIRELVVISGKGGTGKTSLTASFAVLAKNAILVDGDVDAADLHLILSPQIKRREEFRCGHEAVIRQEACSACGTCMADCRFDAVGRKNDGPRKIRYQIDPLACEGCGVCVRFCAQQAIDFEQPIRGEWFISDTRCGPLVHARLGIGAENSGKLVSTIRQEARQLAARQEKKLIIIDGPPGIGCPVIASVTGAALVLVVTEPTVSGEHDLQRVLALTRHFNIPTAVCVNKWNLNPAMTKRIENQSHLAGAAIAGHIRFDSLVTTAQIHSLATVERNGEAAADIRALWKNLKKIGSEHEIDF